GNNLEVRVPITVGEAALGAKIDLPTPRGTITLTIPPNSSSGRRLRVKGFGVQPAGEPAGDLFAVLQVMLPPQIEEQDKEWLRQFDRRYNFQPRSDLTW